MNKSHQRKQGTSGATRGIFAKSGAARGTATSGVASANLAGAKVKAGAKKSLAMLLTLVMVLGVAISGIGSPDTAYAATSATYTQKTDPDAVYTFDGKTAKDQDGNEVEILTEKKNGKTEPVDGKEALWEDENKTKGSIILSYKRDNVQSLYLATMCSAHGMDNATFSEELNALARLTDVNLYLEGWDFYGSSFGIENLTGAAERAENIPWQSGMKVINQSSGHQYIERIPTSETITLGEGKYQYKNIAPNPAYNNPEAFNTQNVLYEGITHSGATVTLSGEHANVIAFANDIVEMLTPPADPVAKAEWEKNVKPEFIIMSFDANAWASAGAGLESDNWKEDAAVMKQAAELLKEYYPSADNPQSRVLWLVPDEVYKGGRDTNDNAIGDNGLVSPQEFGSEQVKGTTNEPVPYVYTWGRGIVRYAEQYFNYPRSTEDYKSIFITPFGLGLTYKGPEYATAIDDFKSDPYENLERDVEQAGRVLIRNQYIDFAKEWRTSIGREGLSSPDMLRYNFNNNNASATAPNARRNMLANKTYVKYFAKSKRIPFYQFALLDPVTYLSCVDANGEPTNIPTYESWYNEGKNIRAMKDNTLNYSDAQKITTYVNDNFVEYDSYVFEDTVSADLKLDDKNYTKNTDADSNTAGKTVEVQYWDEASETWKPVEKTYKDIDGTTDLDDGFDVKIEGQKVTVTMKNINYLGKRVRVVIHVTNDDFSFATEDGEPKDTNEGEASAECQKEGKSLNNGESKVNYLSPKLRKLPDTASISIFKKWDDKDNQDGLREEVAKVMLESKLTDGEYATAKDVNGNEAKPAVVPVKDGLVVTWLDMPVHKNGVNFTYKVTEDLGGLAGYKTKIDKEEFKLEKNKNTEVVVTNTRATDVTEITITKEWDDQDDKEGLRPDNITLTLEKKFNDITIEQEEVDKQVTVAGTKYTVKTTGEEPDTIEYFKIGEKYYRGDDIKASNSKVTDYEELTVFDPSDSDENATEKVTVDGTEYDVKVTAGDKGTEYYVKDDKYYSPSGEELLVFVPSDDDDTVKVEKDKDPTYEEKEDTVQSVTLSDSDADASDKNKWTTTIKDLDKNAPEGQVIAYSVIEKEEDVPDGYTATVTSTEDGVYVVKNKHVVPKYTITYDANGGSGTMTDDNYQGGDSTMPSKANTFTREGYDFVGFIAYDEDGNELLGGKVFKTAEEFANYFKDKPDGTKVKLVAQWEKKEEETKTVKRTIRYWIENVDGTKAFEDVVQEYTFTRTKTTNPDGTVTYGDWSEASHNLDAVSSPAKSGYTVDRSSVDAVSVSPDDEDIVEDVIYTPIKTNPPAKTHWVTYIDPDGTVYTEKTNYKDKDTEIPAPTPSKDGYVFDGWDRSEDEDGNVTYVAKWKKATDKPKPSDDTKQDHPKPTDNSKPTDNPKPTDKPKTGDDNNLSLWISLMAVCLIGMVSIAFGTRKRYVGKHRK